MTRNISVALYTNAYDIETKGTVSVGAGCSAGHINNIEIALARIDTNLGHADFLKIFDDCLTNSSVSDEFILVSNYRKDDLIEKYNDCCKNGLNIKWVIPEFARMSVGQLGMDASREVKWVINDEI